MKKLVSGLFSLKICVYSKDYDLSEYYQQFVYNLNTPWNKENWQEKKKKSVNFSKYFSHADGILIRKYIKLSFESRMLIALECLLMTSQLIWKKPYDILSFDCFMKKLLASI